MQCPVQTPLNRSRLPLYACLPRPRPLNDVGTFFRLRGFHLPLSCHSQISLPQAPRPQSLQLLLDILPIIRDLMRHLRLWPEIRDREATIEVRAEVVHESDGKHDVETELMSADKDVS